MEKNIDFKTQLYHMILNYATDIHADINMKELKELGRKAGYTERELGELITEIYNSIPVSYSMPQEKKNK